MAGLTKRIKLIVKKLSYGWTLHSEMLRSHNQFKIVAPGSGRREEIFISDSDFYFIKENYQLRNVSASEFKLLK